MRIHDLLQEQLLLLYKRAEVRVASTRPNHEMKNVQVMEIWLPIFFHRYTRDLYVVNRNNDR